MIEQREYVNELGRVTQNYYYPVVEFAAAQDSRLRSVQWSEGGSLPQYEVGDEVIVLYELDHPLNARIKSFVSSYLLNASR